MTPRRAVLLLALLAALPSRGLAQVGHDPAHSPYHTLRFGQFIGVTGGWFQGNGGQVGVAPHHGSSLGLRFDFFSNGMVSLGIQGSYLRLERQVVDPTKPIATAVSGPFRAKTGIGEVIMQFNLTGGKTWHGLAPFVSGGIGVMRTSATPQDTSGFKFRTRFALTPGIGTRIFLADRLFLRIEIRNAFWSVTYPDSYRSSPATAPTEPPVLASPAKEWLANGWYAIGLSYAFNRPF